MKIIVWLILLILYSGLGVNAQSSDITVKKLEAYKRIDQPARDEVSGIVKSRKHEDTYWVHGDSGTKDHIYAINSKGEIKSIKKKYEGAEIKGAKNKDWEDIALGEDGTLILADFGNNCHCRDDLKILIIEEPEPDDDETDVLAEYRIKYPEREGVLSLFIQDNHNAEAVFMRAGNIYIITKNESGGEAKLFRLDNPVEDEVNIPTEVSAFKFRGQVTAADISPDESKLAVLTYRSIWLFDLVEGIPFFDGKKYWQPIQGVEQVESIAFSGDDLIIAEENGDLYRTKWAEIPEY
ncbi:MAG: hypothetical protein JJ971_13585 [Balneolaceae bacterium]|nr:hypothetical protein [Balneolaceae bacterium]MBO6547112.1 hypothetical protein [Balneolaceae bacterium]MBO6647941.1 hypothetical protein [Balneolaceae bacterium]